MITAAKTYELFLDGVKKEYTSTVTPPVANRLLNAAMMDKVLEKLPETEMINKRVEDLSQLLITLDTSDYPPIPTITNGSNAFLIPRIEDLNIGGHNYPQELKILNMGFKMYYKGHRCFPDGLRDNVYPATLLRTDEKYAVFNNPHRIPTLGPPKVRMYFQIYKDKIIAIVSRKSTESYAAKLVMEYYRYPREFFFDRNNPEDIPNGNSVPFEFRDEFIREIIDHAVLTYIERVQDPRFQTKKIENDENKRNL